MQLIYLFILTVTVSMQFISHCLYCVSIMETQSLGIVQLREESREILDDILSQNSPNCLTLKSYKEFTKWVIIVDQQLLVQGANVLHIRIYDGVIWHEGDEALDLREQIQNNLIIKIDNVVFEDNDIRIMHQLQRPVEVFDPSGSLLGSHYPSTDVYIFNIDIDDGPHQLLIEFTSSSSIAYMYCYELVIIG
jgi:hypothetical protein